MSGADSPVLDVAMPRLTRALEEEVDRGSALGASAHVRHHARVVFDAAIGRRDHHQPLSAEDDVPWFSASKIASSIAVARAWERGLLDLDERVSTYLPEFAGGGKDRITCRQLWTHSAPLQGADRAVNTSMSWPDAIDRICSAEADGESGGTGYLGHAGMLLLGEIVARRSGIPFADFLNQEVAAPLTLRSRLGPPARPSDLVEVPFLGVAPTKISFDASAGFPGNCITGPIREAALLCQLLVDHGRYDGAEVLRPGTVTALTTCQHSTAMDRRLGMPVTTGLGFTLDEFSFGRYCSTSTFGHSGARSSVAFSDPDAGISAAIFFNGTCALEHHVRRISAASSAIYLDLGLAETTQAGRVHPGPFGLQV